MSNWTINTSEGQLIIDGECAESFPCQHFNNLKLSSVAIWRLIKQNPELEQTEPDLWEHFKCYDAKKFDSWGKE